MDIREFL